MRKALLPLVFALGIALGSTSHASLVVGHTNPDVDAVTSAIAFADFLRRTGIDKTAEAVVQGKVNAETAFVLKTFGVATPRSVTEAGSETFFLTDTTELSQAPKGLKPQALRGILDHHRLGDVASADPLYVWMAPFGSSNTVLLQCYRSHGIKPNRDIAGLMLSGVLSDTIGLKSPTTTETDKEAVAELARLAMTDTTHFTKALLTVKCDVSGLTGHDLVTRDGKMYTFGAKTFWVAQVETTDLAVLDARLDELKTEMRRLRREKHFEAVFLCLTDILQGYSLMHVEADDPELATKLWKVPRTERGQKLLGVTSRKKQLVPVLQRYFN